MEPVVSAHRWVLEQVAGGPTPPGCCAEMSPWSEVADLDRDELSRSHLEGSAAHRNSFFVIRRNHSRGSTEELRGIGPEETTEEYDASRKYAGRKNAAVSLLDSGKEMCVR